MSTQLPSDRGHGGTFAIAGCTDSTEDAAGSTRDDDNDSDGGSENGSDGGDSEDGNESTDGDDSSDDGGDEEVEGSPPVEIADHELVVEEAEYSAEMFVVATIENTGDAPSGQIELKADWYDAEGNYLDNDLGCLASLGGGETWAARVYRPGDVEAVDGYELAGELIEEAQPVDPDGLELVDSEMEAGEDEVIVRGEIENTSGEMQDTSKLQQSSTTMVEPSWATSGRNVTDFRDGETWAFDLTRFGRGRSSEVADHEILIGNSAF